jgi:hypothetical protein
MVGCLALKSPGLLKNRLNLHDMCQLEHLTRDLTVRFIQLVFPSYADHNGRALGLTDKDAEGGNTWDAG